MKPRTSQLAATGASTDDFLRFNGSLWLPHDLVAADVGFDATGLTSTGATDVQEAIEDLDAAITAGGGSSSSAGPSPDDIPLSPSAYDYEFNGSISSVPTGWSWLNQGSSTYQEQTGGAQIDLATSATDDNWRGIYETGPTSSTFTVTAKLQITGTMTSGKFPGRGLILRESSTGHFVVLYLIQNNGFVAIDYYTAATTWSSRPGSTVALLGPEIAAGTFYASAPAIQYLRVVKNSSSSWDFAVSPDGVAWIKTHAGLNIGSLLTPDQIGLAGNTRSCHVVLGAHWIRVT